MRELVLVLEIERGSSRSTLLLAGEALEHTLLGRHRRIVLAEAAVNDAAHSSTFGDLV